MIAVNTEDALDACRDAGFIEEEWCHDVRAGRVQLDVLTADTVVFVSEAGTPLDMGDATNLWESYQNGSIFPPGEKP